MTALWLNSRSERLVAAYLADDRPAWLWAAEGEKRLWCNHAALVYEIVHRRQPDDTLIPVPRQIPRAVRLGAPLCASRSHLQFTLGRKPVSETCVCTPLLLAGEAPALLVVMSKPMSDADLMAIEHDVASVLPFANGTSHYVLTGSDGQVLFSAGEGAARFAASQSPDAELSAGAAASRLLLFSEAQDEPVAAVAAPAEVAADFGAPADAVSDNEDAIVSEDMSPSSGSEAPGPEWPQDVGERGTAPTAANAAPDGEVALEDEADAVVDVQAETDTAGDKDEAETENTGLVDLFDRLASRKVLYEPLGDQDDGSFAAPDLPVAPAQAAARGDMPDVAGGEAQLFSAPEAETASGKDATSLRLWRVLGRNFLARSERLDEAAALTSGAGLSEVAAETVPDTGTPREPVTIETIEAPVAELVAPDEPVDLAEETGLSEPAAIGATGAAEEAGAVAQEEPAAVPSTDKEIIERTSRYNFDELSRILTDRVSGEGDTARQTPDHTEALPAGSLVNLGDETLILNRLPLGLLVFRDQEILFSNRALADLLGYLDGSSLRRAGLAGVFPPDGDQSSAGPVTRLMGADGRLLNVSARLQTISWQGRPALLLSASRHKEPLNAEDLARSFAEIMANALDCGYFETSRAGILTAVSERAATLVDRKPDSLVGRPIHGLIALNQGARLRSFLEQPARFAGVQRPMMQFVGAEPNTEVIVFAEGMAGIVTGYFGLLHATGTASAEEAPSRGIDPNFLIRLSRAIRQPVNAIVGFADMIRTQAFGPVGNERYIDYAKFIGSGGQDIASVVDELENYARLADGEYAITTARIDLVALLEHCVARVRAYANGSRVLVRSAISASLPGISADRETLTQAVLNILASAIAHTPSGGQVVLSAQKRTDGSVEVHVRDGSPVDTIDMDEGFVVFRDGHSVEGEALSPVPSAIGLALTRSLLSVNACSLAVEAGPGNGTLLSLVIPAELVDSADSAQR